MLSGIYTYFHNLYQQYSWQRTADDWQRFADKVRETRKCENDVRRLHYCARLFSSAPSEMKLNFLEVLFDPFKQLSIQQLRLLLNDLLPDDPVIYSYQEKDTKITPLHVIARIIPDKERFELLVRKNFSLNGQETEFLNTPLHLLIANERQASAIDLIKVIKRSGRLEELDLKLKDKFGCNIFCMAAKFRQSKVALYLLREFPCDRLGINEADEMGNTALHYACLLGQTTLVKELLHSEYEVDVHATNLNSKRACDLLDCDRLEIESILKSVHINPNRDEFAIFNHFYDKSGQILPSSFVGTPQDSRNKVEGIEMKKENRARLISRLESPVVNVLSLALIVGDRDEILPLFFSDEDKLFIKQQADVLTGTSLIERICKNQGLIKNQFFNDILSPASSVKDLHVTAHCTSSINNDPFISK